MVALKQQNSIIFLIAVRMRCGKQNKIREIIHFLFIRGKMK